MTDHVMGSTKSASYMEIGNLWQSAFDEGGIDKAIDKSIELYNSFRNSQDNDRMIIAREFLGLSLRMFFDNGSRQTSNLVEQSCSFCGKSDAQVRLAAGPSVLICSECVDLFQDAFAAEG